VKSLVALALLLSASPAFAQRTELAVLAGYTTRGDIGMKTVGIQTLEVKDSFSWGGEATRFLTDHAGVQVSFTQQESALSIGTRAGRADLFDLSVGVLQGSFVYRLSGKDARLEPFVTAGLGATFMSATALESETKLSWSVGAGVTWFPRSRWGLRLQGRYAPTVLGDSSSDFCDPFGFCQGTLHQFELTGGLALRF